MIDIWHVVPWHKPSLCSWIQHKCNGCLIEYGTISIPDNRHKLDCIYEYHGGCLIRNRNCLPFASAWVHPRFFGGVLVRHLFSFRCCLCFVLFVFTLCLVYPMFVVSLGCPFLILLSVSLNKNTFFYVGYFMKTSKVKCHLC